MKKVILITLLNILMLANLNAQGYCNNQSFLEVLSASLGSPLNGPYKPCEEVLFCYTIVDFNSDECNWLHGIVPDYGDCWDETSFSPVLEGLPNQILSLPTNNSGNGAWGWYSDGEITYNDFGGSLPPGAELGPGFFYQNYVDGPAGADAGETWGDGISCNSQGLIWSFCFGLTTECDPNCGNAGEINCSLSIKSYADGETGAREIPSCTIDAPNTFDFNVTCCEQPTLDIDNSYAICSGELFELSLPSDNSNINYNYWVSQSNNVTGMSSGSGTEISQTLINQTLDIQTVTYVITPTNTAGGCDGESVVVDVTIYPNLQVDIQGSPVVCANACIYLFATANIPGDYTYEWNQGVVLQDEEFSYCQPIFGGSEEFQVTITDNTTGCTAISAPFYVEELLPVFLDLGLDAEIPCGESSITIAPMYDLSINFQNIFWNGPNGFSSNNINIDVIEPGIYILTIFDENGCPSFDNITISEATDLEGVNAGEDVNLPCGATGIGLDASNSLSGSNYIHQWSTSDGQILFDGETLFPFVEAGTYTLTTIDLNTGCSGSDEVTVFNSLAVIANGETILDCNNPIATLDGSGSAAATDIIYEWTTNDGNIVDGENTNTAQVDAAGTYILVVTDTLEECSSTAQIEVEDGAFFPIADGGGDQYINCLTDTPTLDASGSSLSDNITLEWTGPDGTGYNEAVIMVSMTGAYVLTLTNNDSGCSATDIVMVEEDFTTPALNIAGSINLNCFNGATVDIGSNGPTGAEFDYEWTGPQGATIDNANTATATVDMIGLYTLVVTNTNNGCTASDQWEVVDDFSIALTTTDVNCEEGDGMASIQTTGIADPVFIWSNGASSTSSTIEDLEPGNYNVVIATANGTCTDLQEFEIEADLSCKVYIGGHVYADFIVQNCELDEDELGLEGITVTLQPENISVETDANGYYEFEANTGDYTIEVGEQDPYILQCPIDGVIPVSLPDTSDVSFGNDFFFQVITDFDLIISARSNPAIAGESQLYRLNYCNFGTQQINGILKFTHDPLLTFDPVATGADSYDPETRTASWNFTNLPFLGCNAVNFNMDIPLDIPDGTILVSQAVITPIVGDINAGNNSKTWNKTVTGASSIGFDQSNMSVIEMPAIANDPSELPSTIELLDNQPNPFRGETLIRFKLPASVPATISVYDLTGKVLKTYTVDFSKGYNEWLIKEADLSGQGMLIYKVETANESVIGKMMKL